MRSFKRKAFRSRTIFYLILFLSVFWFYQKYFAPIKFKFPVEGGASWYSRWDRGINKRTANNEVFNDRALTCAMWGVPFNTRLKVTNQSNGKYVIVRVNDRGPHRRYVKEGRVIDLTKAAFHRISSTKHGLISVRVEKIEDENEKM